MQSLQTLVDSDTTDAKTDKGTHGYLPIYEKLFAPLRDTQLPILEIGIGQGGSLRVWREWFMRAEIHGIDIRPPLDLGPRITTHQGNAIDGWFMGEISRLGPFAIVIDDGGHRGDEQEAAFLSLWAAVAPGGLYVIEDLHASYIKDYHPSVMQFLKQLADVAVNPKGEDMAGLDSIHFYRKFLVAEKKP